MNVTWLKFHSSSVQGRQTRLVLCVGQRAVDRDPHRPGWHRRVLIGRGPCAGVDRPLPYSDAEALGHQSTEIEPNTYGYLWPWGLAASTGRSAAVLAVGLHLASGAADKSLVTC